MHQVLFLIVASIGAAYFLISRRRFDYHAVAYFGSLIYFLPGFFGYTAFHTGGVWVETKINDETYLVFSAVVVSIWLFAQIGANVKSLIRIDLGVPNARLVVHSLLFFSVFGAFALSFSAGNSIHDADKAEVMESLGRWHILFYSAATLGLPLSYATKQYKALSLFFVLLCFDLYLGFRSSIAISLISTVTVYLASKPKARLLLSEFKVALLTLAIGFFFFLYKVIAFAVKSGMWDLVWNRLSDGDTYAMLIKTSEPFVIQQILNDVVASNFKIDFIDVFSVFSQFIIFGPELGLHSPSFNASFQPALFPSVEYGMASNIWAQMWSSGGWGLLICFIFLFNLVLVIGNATLRSPSLMVRVGFAPGFVYWAFYIHRNDIGYAVNIEKRLLMVLMICACLVYLFRFLSKRHNRVLVNAGSGNE